MTTFIALLRAVNVGGTGKLPMKDLVSVCERIGFDNVRTYIQSGNVVFRSALPSTKVRTTLEDALEKHTGKKIDALVRTAAELDAIREANPFKDHPANKVAVVFLPEPINTPPDTLPGQKTEQLHFGKRELYIYFPDGMGQSRLKFPWSPVTARSINTVTKLVAISNELTGT